jgi:hypothetical protein
LGVQTVRTGAGFLILLVAGQAHAARLHRSRVFGSRHASGVSLRKRLHVNDLITEPGTVELDWSGLYSYRTGIFTLPSALKFTPAGGSLFRGRTEYSVAFDSVASAVSAGGRSTQFSDRLTFAATSVIYDSPHFDIALAPQVTAFLRNESGARLGATAIARYDGGGNSIGTTVSWTAASSATDTNPAGVWDFGAGYGRRLASSGVLSRLTPHVNAVLEKSTGFERTLAVFGGVEYHISERVAVDASGQRFGLAGGSPDRQFLLGLTINLGKGH